MTSAESIDDRVDVLAIGCGPFNLGLAALASRVDELSVLVVDSREEFRWHPGLMFEDATLQVSFLSDLVSLVDPTHPLSFLAYLADIDRLYPFLVREDFFPTRVEYEAYLRWVVARLDTLRFGTTVDSVSWDGDEAMFRVAMTVGRCAVTVLARHIVVGVGTEPSVPQELSSSSGPMIHSSEYLFNQEAALSADSVTVIGSGQSGAEIVIDLLEANLRGGPAVRWWTRTPWFAPLDFTKLSLEMTTPAYMDYFHSLPESTRDRIRPDQWQFHKGISTDSLDRIHDLLYRRQLQDKLRPVQFRIGVEVEGLDDLPDGKVRVRGRHRDTGVRLAHNTAFVVAATGYRPRQTAFLAPLEPHLRRDGRGRLVVDADHGVATADAMTGRVFVANAEEHAFGVSSPNLDIGAIRNAKILNAIAGREVYRLPRHTAFTSFDAVDDDDVILEG